MRASREAGIATRRLLRRHPRHQPDADGERRSPVRLAVVRRHAGALLPHRPAARRRPSGAAAELGRVGRRDARGAAARRRAPLRRAAAARTSPTRCSRWRCSRAAAERRRHARRVRAAGFRRALGFYDEPVPRGPRAGARRTAQISNVWDEFARGLFAFYVSGPWNIGEFRRRLPRERQQRLGDCAAAGPRRAGRLDRRRLEPRAVQALAAQGRGVAADRVSQRAGDDAALPRADRQPAAAAQRVAGAGARRRRAVAGLRPPARTRARGAEDPGVGAHLPGDAARRRARRPHDARHRCGDGAARRLGRCAAREAPLAARADAAAVAAAR